MLYLYKYNYIFIVVFHKSSAILPDLTSRAKLVQKKVTDALLR